MPVTAGTTCTLSLTVWDNDPAGRARPGLYFYSEDYRFITSYWSATYSEDSPDPQILQVRAQVPTNVAYVRGIFRMYAISQQWDGNATVSIDNWQLNCQ